MDLPQARPARERADAARNRARVLAAAERLFARGGGSAVTMEQIAAAAGVGKGTLYRRYPDVASIAHALLDEHERALQDELLGGPPPLGPGAPPAERLAAFYRAMVALLERHGHIALAGETGARRYRTGAYRAWALHVDGLLREAGLGSAPRSSTRCSPRWRPTSSPTSAPAACRPGRSSRTSRCWRAGRSGPRPRARRR